MAHRLWLSRQEISPWITQFHARQGIDITARVASSVRSGRPRTLQGRLEPLIVAVITRDPRDLGDYSTVWTAPLLTQYLREKQALPTSRPSVSRALARLGLRWKRPRHRVARRPATWRQAKGGANGSLRTRHHTVRLMLDETIMTETPPLVACSGHRGEPVEVSVTGQQARRVLHGVLNIQSGGVLFLLTATWEQQTHQAFLAMMRQHWARWHIILFEDCGSPHTAVTSRKRATGAGQGDDCIAYTYSRIIR